MTATPLDRPARIAAAFGRAHRYEEAAAVQRAAAVALARRIAAAELPPRPRILELGCGTGFLTRAIAEAIGPARWTVTDIAPAMLERARAALDFDADFRVADGEAVDPALGAFDLIASSLAFQWFEDMPGAVARLADRLCDAGLLAFTTMAAGSFPEWTAALAAEGLSSGMPAYPDQAALRSIVPQHLSGEIEVVDMAEPQRDARSFLHGLKAIGASIPATGYRPSPPAALRRAMARFDAGPRIVTYRIGFCLLRRISG
ncbi:methyltransferase domain-containing protein [Rhizorhabdus argentea]|uniref:methyltransferase domain-containing protein n=1 Tax=Rhizorhabdus argentea TaxID=1387174 RepID=UPI0030EB13B0